MVKHTKYLNLLYPDKPKGRCGNFGIKTFEGREEGRGRTDLLQKTRNARNKNMGETKTVGAMG